MLEKATIAQLRNENEVHVDNSDGKETLSKNLL